MGVIYRHHFIGSTGIMQGTNATKLKEVLERESTKNLGAEALKSLRVLRGNTGPATSEKSREWR